MIARPTPMTTRAAALQPEQRADDPVADDRSRAGRSAARTAAGATGGTTRWPARCEHRQDERVQGHGPDCTGARPNESSGPSDCLERHPVALDGPVDDVEPGRLDAPPRPLPRGRRRCPRRATAAGPELVREVAGQGHQDRRRSGSPGRGRTAPRPYGRLPDPRGTRRPSGCAGHWPRSPRWRSGRCRRRTRRRPELDRRDGQDPRPQPTSRTRRPRPAGPRSASGLDAGEAQPGRRVEPGPEGHPWIEREDDVIGRAPVAPPGRSDDQPPADPQDREMGLPGVGPVLLVDEPRPSSPIGRSPNAWRWPSASVDLGDGATRPPPGRAPGTYARTIAGRSGRSAPRGPRRRARTPARRVVPPGATRRRGSR